MNTRALVLSVMALSVLACGGQTDRTARLRAAEHDHAINAAERMVRQDPTAALAQFAAIAADQSYPQRDRLTARYRQGELLRTAGQLDGAVGHFQFVADSPDIELSGMAAYRLARLQFEARGDYEGGRAALLEVARSRPDTLGAVQAIKFLVRARPQDPAHSAWLIPSLDGLAQSSAAIAPAAAWWKAQVEVHGTKDLAAARASLRAFVARHPENPRVGSALWLLGELLCLEKAWDRAASVYDELSQVEPDRGWFIGSNRERRVDDAILKSGRIHLHRLSDARGAIERFERLLDEMPLSILADDAAYGLARAQAAAGRSGEARDALASLMETYPHSRHGDAAKAILDGAPWPKTTPKGVESSLQLGAEGRP